MNRTDAGLPVTMLRPHLHDIPAHSLPEGFTVRGLCADDAGLWADIQRDSDPWYRPGKDTFYREFGGNLPILGLRSFLIEDARGVGATIISAWYNRDFDDGTWGQVHWVATRPAFRRKGLAKAGLSLTLRTMTRWHEKSFLHTQTLRLAAIKLYLDFGFRPDMRSENADIAWREVADSLPHPALADLRF